MKIDAPLNFPQQLEPRRVGTTGSSPSPSPGETSALSTDMAKFSADGEQVQQLKAGLAAVPDLRQDRVAALQNAIASGSYNVSGKQIAEAMSADLQGGE